MYVLRSYVRNKKRHSKTAAIGLMMVAGYLGGAAMLPVDVGGKGFNAGQTHEILAPFVEPISIAILVLSAGVVAGGIAFLLVYRSKQFGKEHIVGQ